MADATTTAVDPNATTAAATTAGATTPNLTVQGAGTSAYTDPAAYVTSLYQNVLGRAPDPQGFKFWTDSLQSGKGSTGQVLQGFLDSPEYQAKVAKGQPATAIPTTTPTAAPLSTYDPYTQYRGQAATQLNQLVNNPSIAMSQGGYQAQLQQGVTASQRAAAATGQLQSGAEQNAISNLAQGQFSTYYNNLFNQLSTLSGASQAPASATAAQNAAQVQSYLAPYQGQSLAAGAALQQTQANVAGYMAPYTAAQTQAQTSYISGPQSQLAQAQAHAADIQAKATGASMWTGGSSGGGILGAVGDVVGSIVSLF